MDMKRILQAMDGVATKPVVGVNDMARFLRVVSEGDINPLTPKYGDPKEQASEYIRFSSGLYNKSTLPPTMSFGPGIAPLPVTFTPLAQGVDISKTVQANINAANARLPKELQKSPEEMSQIVGGADKPYQGPSINDINQPVGTPVQENSLDKFLSIVKKNDVSILNEGANPHKVSLPVQMAMQHYQKEESTHKPVGRDSVIRKYFKEVEEELTAEKTEKRQLINQYASIIAERVLMKESLDEACWDKYKQVGMKKKGRKMVPNCVPKESVISEKSTTEKQARTMAAAAHNPEFAKKVGIKPSVAKEFNQKDKGTALLSNAMKKKKNVKENEIPGHSMGFTGGVGPGMIDTVIDEMPLGKLNTANPIQTDVGLPGLNPGTIEYRIMRARAQIKDLASRVDSNELIVWESIARQFPELADNMRLIEHGIAELAKIRKQGGRRSRNIDKHIGESVMPSIKASKPTASKIVKPKAKTSVCRAGQTQTGTQIKNGMSVPKCSVTSVKKKVAEDNIGYLPKVATDAGGIAVSTAMLSTIWDKLQTPVFGDFKYYTYLDLINDLGIVSASFITTVLTGPETLGAGPGIAIVKAWPAVERLASVLSKAIKALRLFLPDVPSMILAIKKLAIALYKLDAAELARFASILVKDGLPAALTNIGINFGMEKLDKALDDEPSNVKSYTPNKQQQSYRAGQVGMDTPNNPDPRKHPERYPTQ